MYMRWNMEKGYTLKEMQQYRSGDYTKDGEMIGEFSGICATQSNDYMYDFLTNALWDGELEGEIILFEGVETGERCMDDQPIVYPTKILGRIDVTVYYDKEQCGEDWAEYIDEE